MQKTRLQFIDFMKGVAIFNVLVIHLYLSKEDVFFQSIMHRLCIPVFVFVTGYTMGFIEDRPYVETILKKLSYVIKLFFIFSLLTYIANNNSINIIEVFKNTLYGKVSLVGNFANAALWYFPFYISLFFVIFTTIKLTKLFYDKFLRKLGGWPQIFYYVVLVIVSICLSMSAKKLDVGAGVSVENNPFFINHALVMQFLAIVGYIVFNIENKIKKIIDEKKIINDEIISDMKVKQVVMKLNEKTFIITGLLQVLRYLLVGVVIYYFIHFTKRYGLIDILGFLWSNNFELYLSCTFACLSLYFVSKIICDLFGNFFLFRYIAYMGKRALFICGIHAFFFKISLDYYEKNFPEIYTMFKEDDILTAVFASIVLSVISVLLSFAIEREK
ncbi:MAG: hypothetical protein IJ593_02990 [Lachnospiraceae bacterium]|nr:hypothetical protein [Lachnospiraceae bacterium]